MSSMSCYYVIRTSIKIAQQTNKWYDYYNSGCGEVNPFTRNGLARSPLWRAEAGGCSCTHSVSVGISSSVSMSKEVMDEACLMRGSQQLQDGVGHGKPPKIIDELKKRKKKS